MRKLVVLAAALVLAPSALAQPGLSTKPNYDLIYSADRIDESGQKDLNKLHNDAVTALQAKDYAGAEAKLTDLLKRSLTPPSDTPFLMGLAKIGLEKWAEAAPFLEAAVAAEPQRPEPKTRLGLALVMLDKPAAAREQREALIRLDIACNNTCGDNTWINDGIRTLDQALAARSPANQSAQVAASAAVYTGGVKKDFDPAAYNLTAFEDSADLYDLLTKPGRCPEKTAAEPRQPCALILYRPADGSPTGGLAANFKPVFKVVNRSTIWAIHDKKLQKVKVEDLYFDNDDVIGQARAKYMSVALVGNAENQANCAAGKQCLANLVSEDMFRMYGNMPDSVVEVVWGSGMKDVATVRVR